MTPTETLETAMTTTLATSTTGSLSVALKVTPVSVAFTPGEDMSALSSGDMTPTAAALGISVGAATRVPARNPLTGDYMIAIQPPAGGFQEVSGAGGSYPVSIYGCVLTKTPHAIPGDIIGSKRFAETLLLTGPNQLIDYGDINYSFAIGAWF